MLQQLGLKYGTDKANHKHRGRSYLDIYDYYFEKRRLDVRSFVEIGINNGSSLKMWRDYFPHAIIHGVDIDPRCKVNEEERVKIHIGDQNDDEFLNSLSSELGSVDILLDDGSHITTHQIRTFNHLYGNIVSNGFYLIEDLRNSYEEVLNHHDIRKIWPGMTYNKSSDPLKNYRSDFDAWIQSKIKNLDFHDESSKLFGIYHYPMIVIFENKE